MQNAPTAASTQSDGIGRVESASVPGRREGETRPVRGGSSARLGVVEDEHAEREQRQARTIQSCIRDHASATSTMRPRQPSGQLAPTRVGLGDDLAELFVIELRKPCSCFPGWPLAYLVVKVRIRRTWKGKQRGASGPPPFS